MKTKKTKLSFTKATVVNLGNIFGGKENDVDSITFAETCNTNCDRDTDCYAVSRCWTECGPGGNAC